MGSNRLTGSFMSSSQLREQTTVLRLKMMSCWAHNSRSRSTRSTCRFCFSLGCTVTPVAVDRVSPLPIAALVASSKESTLTPKKSTYLPNPLIHAASINDPFEIMLTANPKSCDAVRHSSPNSSGYKNGSPPRKIFSVPASASRRSPSLDCSMLK